MTDDPKPLNRYRLVHKMHEAADGWMSRTLNAASDEEALAIAAEFFKRVDADESPTDSLKG